MRTLRFIPALIALTAACATETAPGASPRDLPLFFIPNSGQAPAGVRYFAKGSGLTAYFFDDEVAFRRSGAIVRTRFESASSGVRIQAGGPLPGRVNFLTGPQSQWRSDIPIYSMLAYRGLYAGVDATYGVAGRNLKSEFTIAPGADPGLIRIRYVGAGAVQIAPDGALVVATASGALRELPPSAWQTKGTRRIPVDARFTIDSTGAVGFRLGSYDPALPLVIDPVLSYSTFVGGSSDDAANAIAVDSSGAAYIAGFTESYDLPTVTPVQASNGGGNDVFIAKLSASGSALIYCTYLGGSGDDRALGIAVDSTGAAYITGSTQSPNFPVRNAYQASLAGAKNAFVVKLTAAGNNVAYSTYLGGNGSDAGNGIAVDSSGNAYVVGDTTSTNFPVNSYQKTYRGAQDAFITKLNAAGSALVYSTYLGGGNVDHGAAIAVDSTGAAFITGSTTSTDFPTLSAFQTTNGGGQDAFIARLNPAGSGLLFSTYLGGSGGSGGYSEAGSGIALDSSGNAYVAGVTASANFPVVNPIQSTLNGWTDAFITEVSATGTLLYSTYLGGSGMDTANAIAVDSNGYAYVAGYTYSSDFPVSSALQGFAGGSGSTDAFVVKLQPAANSLAFATYLGGNDSDTATGIAVDSAGNIYVAGWTLSANFPVLNPYQAQNGGNYGAFVTKYMFGVAPSNVSVTPSSGSGSSGSFAFQYSDGNGATDLSVVSALFGASASSLASSCAVVYNRAQNTLALLTDSGAQPTSTIAPGSGTAQNSQCILNGAASNVSLSGNILTLTLALTFQPSFSGAKTIYMQAANPYQSTAWQAEGSWTISAGIAMSVTPSSGNSAQQTFAFQFNDAGGAADLTTVSSLFNTTSASIASACMVTYNRAQNVLTLATDAGAQPSGGIAPGSGSQSNSQCTLNGAASSVSVSGNILTLNLALAFQPAFAGSKNIYMSAAGLAASAPWMQEGAWTSPPAIAMSVSPSSGNGAQQTFTIQITDSTGATDLTTAGVLINSSAATTAACAIIYNRAQNTLSLLTDAGAATGSGITPGSGTAQNSQCTLNGASSTAAVSGNLLTLNVALAFQSGFAGAKSIYAEAANPYETVNWTQEGSWTVPGSISLAVSPSSGSGAQQRFTFQFTDSLGATDLTTAGVLINSSTSTTSACAIIYNRAQNTLSLLTDAGAVPSSPIAPGSGTAQNSQCTLSGASSSATSSGNTLTLSLQIAFTSAFAGTKNVYMDEGGSSQTVGWTGEGTWTILASATSITAFSPASGTGGAQVFAMSFYDPAGVSDLSSVSILINAGANAASACAVTYTPSQNTLMLLTDAGALPSSGITLGSSSQQNSQCVLTGSASSVTISGNVLTLAVAIGFKAAFAGQKNVYGSAQSAGGTSLNWQQLGIWTVAVSNQQPQAVSAMPSSGSGYTQTFALVYSDVNGASDLSSAQVVFNATNNDASACYVWVTPSLGAVWLANDSGSGWPGPLTLGTGGTLQNSQCTLNVGASSGVLSGNTYTLNLALTFNTAFSGARNIYSMATSLAGLSSGWQTLGTWTVGSSIGSLSSGPQLTAANIRPVSGSGGSQIFTAQFSDSGGPSDLANVSLLIGSGTNIASACAVTYSPAHETLMLLTDGGTAPASGIALGSSSQQNSQCVLTGSASSSTVLGNVLTLSIAIGFKSAFAGQKNVYASARSIDGTSLNWQQLGTWTVAIGNQPPQAVSVAPVSGAGLSQSFTFTYTDSNGASDLASAQIIFDNSNTGLASCYVWVTPGLGLIWLANDAETAWPGPQTMGTVGTLQNSQCIVNVGASNGATSGNTYTLNLAMTFTSAFTGAKNLYSYASSFSGLASGWQLIGRWSVP